MSLIIFKFSFDWIPQQLIVGMLCRVRCRGGQQGVQDARENSTEAVQREADDSARVAHDALNERRADAIQSEPAGLSTANANRAATESTGCRQVQYMQIIPNVQVQVRVYRLYVLPK